MMTEGRIPLERTTRPVVVAAMDPERRDGPQHLSIGERPSLARTRYGLPLIQEAGR